MKPLRYIVTVEAVVEKPSAHRNAAGEHPMVEAEVHVYSQTVDKIDLEAIIEAVNESMRKP
jgi:hypothetical protein